MTHYFTRRKALKILLIAAFFLLSISIFVIYIGAHYGGRMLTEPEKGLATSIFADSIDLPRVRLVFDSVYSVFASVSLGNTIHMNSSKSWIDTTSDLTTTLSGRHALIHELAHSSQYQHGGWSYLIKSIYAQSHAWLNEGSRNEAYRWETRLREKTPWENWNPEEQAQAIADFEYFVISKNGAKTQRGASAEVLGCVVPVLKDKYCVTGRPKDVLLETFLK